MPIKEWTFDLEQTKYTVLLEHGTILRRHKLFLNGQPVEPIENILIEKGNRLSFNINEHLITVIIKCSGLSQFEYDLLVNGISVQSFGKVKLPPELVFETKGCLSEVKKHYIMGVVFMSILSFTWGSLERYNVLGGYKLVVFLVLLTIALYFLRRISTKKR